MLMLGPPGSGKSMLAQRLPGLLPPLDPAEALETSMIHSLAGNLQDGKLRRRRPFRDPHHSASLPALVANLQTVRVRVRILTEVSKLISLFNRSNTLPVPNPATACLTV